MDDGTRISPQVEDFLRSARARDTSKCAALLAANPELVNSVEAGGFSALHFAAFGGDVPMIEMLVGFKADLNLLNYDKNTPLMLAAKVNQCDAIRVLLDAGADVNACGNKGSTACHQAASMGHEKALDLLVNRGAKLSLEPSEGGSVLHWACHGDSTTMVGRLIYKYNMPVDVVDVHGGTPLFTALFMKRTDLVTFLLEHGASPKTTTPEDGSTLLHIAVEHGSLADVKLLIAFGADPQAKDKEGKTPLSIAEAAGKRDSVKELVKPPLDSAKRAAEAARFKQQGNKVFAEGESFKAAKFYSLAISLDPTNHVFFSNRSACYFNTHSYDAAYFDACRCVALAPNFVRGYFRKAATLKAKGDITGAEAAIASGLKLDSQNGDLLTLLQEIKQKK